MSLLLMEQDADFLKLTNEIFTRHLAANHTLNNMLTDRARQKMYQDVKYNIDFLYTALCLEDDGIYARYARWLYQLLTPLMTGCSRESLRDIMTEHYELIRTCMSKTLSYEKHDRLHRLLNGAIKATAEECDAGPPAPSSAPVKYEKEVTRYLDCLLQSDTEGALALVTGCVKEGIPLDDVCSDIVAEAMRRVGELWHLHLISVDMEHYCTSVTQMALSQFYPLIFGQPRKGKTVLIACVGSELHEIGARMIADLFEYSGWDSIYLGAAVPVETLLSAAEKDQPDLIALSVTMPQHLPLCRNAVEQLREKFPKPKIAVGGNAFTDTKIWKSWNVDIYTEDAKALVQWADNTL